MIYFLLFMSLLFMCIKKVISLEKKYGILVILVDFHVNSPRFLRPSRIRIHRNETDPTG